MTSCMGLIDETAVASRVFRVKATRIAQRTSGWEAQRRDDSSLAGLFPTEVAKLGCIAC